MISSLCCLPARAVATLFMAVCMRSLTPTCSFSTDDKGKETAKSDENTAGLIAKENDRSILPASKAGEGNVENQLQTSEGNKENQLAVKEKERYFFISQETYDKYTEPLPQDYEHQGRFSFTSFGALFRKSVKKKRFGPLWHLFQAVLSAMPALCLWFVVELKERDWGRKYPELDFSQAIVQISSKKEEAQVDTDAELMDVASMTTLKEQELEKLYNKGVITKEEYEVAHD
ncbi:hypothetical protein GUITHDRAFT_142341 [Guillardia theta CCMP2712]|uniref:SHOCT domain-containing protein n=1 Tax=Guillardia theta (strain CCMP2712) TaxID=905079 RepID=L1IYN8_GUITC|nr:hypothetical protein GUITHDRAFT_142341 [Guillardia theta CCMP2712]EKX40940.1 hypothetical protein GUITHDRAFT_142341 [Guillardia theta CCMP2712]|eukprot:XP_005827920.1 hypothetical protein GUITHDRAFT_142341 [Guillardia theta CCMP2712]